MEIDANFRLMFVSVGTYEQAKRIAEVLISKNLSACCSIISGIESIYRWNDSIMCEKEYLLKIKTFNHAIENIEKVEGTILNGKFYSQKQLLGISK